MLISARDMQDTLLRYLGGNNNVEASLDIRFAIADALKEIWGVHDWPYYQGQQLIQVDAPYSTGTVVYNATTRRVTLTGGVWPTWAEYGTLVLNAITVKVAKRLSDTVIEIDLGSGLTTDIVSATVYQIFRNEYPLGDDVRKVAYITFDTWSKIPLQFVPPLEFNHPTQRVTGTPRYYTIQKDRRRLGGLSIVFWPMPPLAKTVAFCYMRQPKEIKYWSEIDGSISLTADSTAVTGSGTAFESEMANCMLRVGRNQAPVTSLFGGNRYGEQILVESVVSPTSLVCLPAAPVTRTNVKYEISSLIDIDEPVMSSLFTQQCYFELSKRREVTDKQLATLKSTLAMAKKSARSMCATNRDIEYAGTYIRSSSIVWVAAGGNS